MAKKTKSTPAIDGSPESVQRTINTAQAMLDQTAAEGNKAFKGSTFETAVTKKNAGIVTSSDAENRGKNANDTLTSITTPTESVDNPFMEMSKRLVELQKQLETAKTNASIKETKNKLNATPSAEEVQTSGKSDMNAAADALNGDGSTGVIEDPVIRALTDKTIANTGIITNQMNTLSQYRQQFNEYTQQDIDSIARTAERSIQTQIAENDRTRRAMEFSGVIGGRAQFAPITQDSIIHEVIQEGLDKIEVINEKKNTAIREARKAEAEFNIDAFEMQADLAKEYNNEIESTISKMNAQVRQVEADERERITFRQNQETRAALLLADELIDATPEKIQETAAANGIDPAQLAKAVSDAKYAKTMQNLDIQSKIASINASNRSNQPDNSPEESDIPANLRERFRSAQLSNTQSEEIWQDIKDFGLTKETVSMWVEGGISKAQAKAIVTAHEQDQRIKSKDGKDNEVYLPGDNEKALIDVINRTKTDAEKKRDDTMNKFTGTTFFRE